jgi:anaerobic ribonucleoside-triphosphate reductase activating protein
MAKWVLSLDAIEGITLAGGEPMEQAAALCRLIDVVRGQRDLGVITYTGYTLENLHLNSDFWCSELLARTDLLIDGPYVRSLHGRLRWRGSTNQRLLTLTRRYAEVATDTHLDDTAGLEVHIDDGGDFQFVGIPPIPDFRAGFREQMLERGIKFQEGEDKQ